MLFRKESSGFSKSVVIFYPNFTIFLHTILEIYDAGLVVDKYYIMLGKLSCVCGSVRISNFHIHITKTNIFSFAAPGHSVVFIQRRIFKGTSAKLYRKGGKCFFCQWRYMIT